MSNARIYHNKLVRDGIPAKIAAQDEAYEARTITDSVEFEQELLKKVIEEATELAEVKSRGDFLSEYADLMAVLDALTQHYELSEADIRVALTENVTKKGLYKDRQFLLWSERSDYKTNETPSGTDYAS